MSSTDKDQESLSFWSSMIQTLSGSPSGLIDDRYPEISSPILAMSTPMAIDAPPQPCNPPRYGDKEAGPEKGEAGIGDKNINEKSKGKEIEKCKEKEEYLKIEGKSLGKRPRRKNQNILDKRRRNDVRKKIQKLQQMTTRCTKKDLSSTTLDSIIDHIREMELYVESQSVGPMLPLGMELDFPEPWFVPPNFIMPFNGFTQGQSSGHDQQIVPVTTKGLNNQPKSSQSM